MLSTHNILYIFVCDFYVSFSLSLPSLLPYTTPQCLSTYRRGECLCTTVHVSVSLMTVCRIQYVHCTSHYQHGNGDDFKSERVCILLCVCYRPPSSPLMLIQSLISHQSLPHIHIMYSPDVFGSTIVFHACRYLIVQSAIKQQWVLWQRTLRKEVTSA